MKSKKTTKTRSYTIERSSEPKPHICDIPQSTWKRWRAGLKAGAIIKCKECETQWELFENFEGIARWRKLT